MPLRQDVQDAFATLGLTPEVDIVGATKAYKRLALQHHPDRNHGDPSATQRFQQIGHAWDICQRFYDNPAWASRPDGLFGSDDDDIPLDEEDLREFYMFMFAETLFNRYNRARGRRYRYEHAHPHAGGGLVFTFFSPGSLENSQERQDKNSARQKKEREEYERRKRELELEIEEEEREAQEQAKKQKADMDRLFGAQERAFQAAYSGSQDEVQRLVNEFNLDVNAPKNPKNSKNTRKQEENSQYETLLHAAACKCDETLFTFLIEKGAHLSKLNKQQLTPFHAAIKAGNSKIVRFILEQRGKTFQDCHPSKATPSGFTPLQLAIESNDRPTIELLVKHATTHDVERCWTQLGLSEDIREILRIKKGFVPPGEGLETTTRGMSKKAQRQQELAQQKEARIAEELRRAEINRQKKAAKRTLVGQEKVEEESRRLKAEEEERRRLEGLRRAEAELEEVRSRAGAEAEAKAEREAKERLEHETRAKAEGERERVEREAKIEAEREIRERTEREAKEKAERMRVQKERLEGQRRDHERIRKEKEEKERIEKQKHREESERIEKLLEKEREGRERKQQFTEALEQARRQEEARRRAEEAGEFDNAIDVQATLTALEKKKPSRDAASEEHRKHYWEKQRERRKAKAAARREEQKVGSSIALSQKPELSSAVPSSSVSPSRTIESKAKPLVNEHEKSRHEQMMKRRAEQSARDKERHRKVVEERKKAQCASEAQTQSEREYVPLTPVSTGTTRRHDSYYVSQGSAPLHGLVKTDLLFSNETPNPSFMEDVQTCIVPDDLFREDRPSHKATNLEAGSFAPTFESHVEPNSMRSFPPARNKPNHRGYRPKRGGQHQGNHD